LAEQREALRKRLERGDSFLNKFLNSADPSDLKASLSDVEARLKHQEVKLEEFGPQMEASRQKLEFLTKDYKGRLGDYLNDAENAKRLFGYASATDGDTSIRGKLLSELLERLEQKEIIYHLLASYEIRPISAEYSPPVHLQQLSKALVSKEELKRLEGVLKQVPARQLSLKPIEDLSRKIRRFSREEKLSFVVRFAEDFLRLRRDVRNADHLTACMERINLVTTEQARELSRMNNQWYE